MAGLTPDELDAIARRTSDPAALALEAWRNSQWKGGADQYQPPPEEPGVLRDMVQSLGTGAVRGATSLLDLPSLAARGVGWGVGKVAGEDAREGFMGALPPVLRAGVTPFMADILPDIYGYDPSSTPGEYAQTVGEFLPGALLGPGGVARNALLYGVVPGVASEAAGQMTEGTSLEPYARAGAALLAPIAAQAGGNVARGLISPYGGADPVRAGLVEQLRGAGVPVTAGQAMDAPDQIMREMRTLTGQRLLAQQADDFTAAALRTVGVDDASRATPEVMASTYARLGSTMDDIARGTDISPDVGMVQRLTGVVDDYQQMAATGGSVPAIGGVLDIVERAWANNDTIPPDVFASWRRRANALTRSADDATRTAAIATVETLDDALEAQLTRLGRVEDVARLQQTRTQYRNFLALERALVRSDDAAVGIVTPRALASAVTQQSTRDYVLGRVRDPNAPMDIVDLARAGHVLSPPSTVLAGGERSVPQVTQAALGGLGYASLGPAGVIPALLAPSVARNAAMSPIGQAYFQNQLLSPGGPVNIPRAMTVIPGILAGQQ